MKLIDKFMLESGPMQVSILENNRLIKALFRQPVDKTPIWIMRQAGRYLPEYQTIRRSVSGFMQLCKTPELACEVTLQPLRRFDLDAAILFSDILTIPDAMGLELYFSENVGPKFKKPIRDEHDIQRLQIPCVDIQLKYVIDAIYAIKKELKQTLPLIGFAGSPWTLATYMLEGGPSKNFSRIKGLMYSKPDCLHLLLTKLANAITHYLNAQVEAGANAIMIFDSWGGVLSPWSYEEFSLNYMQNIIQNLKKNNSEGKIPTILFTKGGGLWLEKILLSGCDAIGLDWTIDIAEAKNRVNNKVALQGNLDPAVLYGTPEIIKHQARKILSAFTENTGHVFNLGHGIYPDVNPEHLKILVDTVKGKYD